MRDLPLLLALLWLLAPGEAPAQEQPLFELTPVQGASRVAPPEGAEGEGVVAMLAGTDFVLRAYGPYPWDHPLQGLAQALNAVFLSSGWDRPGDIDFEVVPWASGEAVRAVLLDPSASTHSLLSFATRDGVFLLVLEHGQDLPWPDRYARFAAFQSTSPPLPVLPPAPVPDQAGPGWLIEGGVYHDLDLGFVFRPPRGWALLADSALWAFDGMALTGAAPRGWTQRMAVVLSHPAGAPVLTLVAQAGGGRTEPVHDPELLAALVPMNDAMAQEARAHHAALVGAGLDRTERFGVGWSHRGGVVRWPAAGVAFTPPSGTWRSPTYRGSWLDLGGARLAALDLETGATVAMWPLEGPEDRRSLDPLPISVRLLASRRRTLWPTSEAVDDEAGRADSEEIVGSRAEQGHEALPLLGRSVRIGGRRVLRLDEGNVSLFTYVPEPLGAGGTVLGVLVPGGGGAKRRAAQILDGFVFAPPADPLAEGRWSSELVGVSMDLPMPAASCTTGSKPGGRGTSAEILSCADSTQRVRVVAMGLVEAAALTEGTIERLTRLGLVDGGPNDAMGSEAWTQRDVLLQDGQRVVRIEWRGARESDFEALVSGVVFEGP